MSVMGYTLRIVIGDGNRDGDGVGMGWEPWDTIFQLTAANRATNKRIKLKLDIDGDTTLRKPGRPMLYVANTVREGPS